ncbi:MAG: hypothetical protein E7185_01085 [Erysipelotrichaceae bacterium]|nr:hypothetical protein [Erysipelotrichaceae bacterium]
MRKMLKSGIRYVYFSTAFLFLFTVQANAYIDPSVMTYAIQALAGIAIALGTFFGLYWRKIRKPILHFFNLDETAGRETESDELYFYDASCMKEERRITLSLDSPDKKSVKERGKIGQILSDLVPALFITLSGCYMLCICAPLDLYFNNKNEFWFNTDILVPQLIRMMCMIAPVVLLVYLLIRLINKKAYYISLVVSVIAFVCSYIQGNFRIKNLPPMDGSSADWSRYTGENIITLLIWIAVGTIVVWIYRKVKDKGFASVAEVVSVLMAVILSITLVTTAIGSRNVIKKALYVATKDGEFKASKQDNLFILVLDALDAYTYDEVALAHPEYKEWFADFTYYPNTTSVFPFTTRSIPQMLTGKIFENEVDFTEYSTDALDNAEFLRHLEERNYQVGIYETELSYNGDKLSRFENFRTDDVELNMAAKNTFIKEQFKLVLFKYLPYCLKQYVDCNTNSFVSMIWPPPFRTDNWDFYNDIQTTETEYIDQNNFRFIHVEGAHVPFRYDKDMNWISESDGSYYKNIEASMTLANAYIQKLKDAGVYENSAIIIMADHGSRILDEEEDELYKFNPIFMVKGIGENHEYRVDQAPLSYEDLIECYERLMDHKPASECFDWKEGDHRVRRLIWSAWLQEDHMIEYTLDGHASEFEKMEPTGREFNR